MKNPVAVASGTFGYGDEFEGLTDIKSLGAIVTKTITLHARVGNKPPRVTETPAGMLNSIGLENPGVERFLKEKMPSLVKFKIPIIVSIAGESTEEYAEIAKRLDSVREIDGIEINISCPNIQTNELIAQNEILTAEVVKSVKSVTKKTVITKLSPNVTNIVSIAKAAESAGTDAISLINTITAMAVDIKTRESRLGNITGGLSGPAIKPIALHMVWKVYRSVGIPIIGMGGIMDWKDALEFILCGAKAVMVGTANFVNPDAAGEIITGIENYLKSARAQDISGLVGKLRV
ncbi:MAG: dihydroorotate dehydrogenase [Candidatus Omnitrophica bacterium]|nr:dihydroorotate dehydrogenase [Candidatus Omnitrophota bacterium]